MITEDERDWLAWCLVKPAEALTTQLEPEHFTDPRMRALFELMHRSPGWTVDDARAVLSTEHDPGGFGALDDLTRQGRVILAHEVPRLEARLMENFAVKTAESACAAFLRSTRTPGGKNLEAVRELIRGLADAEAQAPIRSRSHRAVASEVMHQWLHALAAPTTAPTLPLPWAGLQAHTGGLPLGKVILIGGRSSEHKTTVARAMADHLASLGHRSLFWTMEDSDVDISGRTLAAGTRLLTTTALMRGSQPRERGGLTQDEMTELLGQVQAQVEGETGKHLRILDKPNPRLAFVLQTIKAEAAKGARAVFLDFIQLIRPDSPRQPATNDWWRDAIAALAGLAKQLKIVIVCTSQIEKTGTKESANDGRVPYAYEMPFGAVLRQGAFGCLMVGTKPDPQGGVKLAMAVDKWKSAANTTNVQDAGQFLFRVDPAHDRLTEIKKAS